MSLKRQALSGFKRMRGDEVAITVSTIIQAMTASLNFPNPTPTLEEVETAWGNRELWHHDAVPVLQEIK